jgi:hypothetical protein
VEAGGLAVHVVRTAEEAERLRLLWGAFPWEREEAELDYLLTRLRFRDDPASPYGVLVTADGEPAAAAVGRLEHRRLDARVGYRSVYAPRARVLQLVDGGVVAPRPEALPLVVDGLRGGLERAEADAVAVPPLAVGSPLAEALGSLGGPLERQRAISPWPRRRLVLPATFDEFVASRSANTRWRIRRDARRLQAAYGDELTVAIVRTEDGLERLVGDADGVARLSYQRALGAGFADTAEQRELARLGLERGWVRGYLLYHGTRPIAYWLCSTYGGRILIRSTGFDPAYAEHRVGLHLLMRVVEDACADPSLAVLDFGPGDAAYKQQFSDESVLERDQLIHAPTFRGRRIAAARGAILGSAQLARRALDAARVTDRVRSGWRGRLRRSRPDADAA